VRARHARQIEALVEAAFDRYNRAFMSDVEPTVGLFLESLEAEGLRLSAERRRRPSVIQPIEDRRQPIEDRRQPVAARRSEGLISRQIRGLS
jgi:hypothetical protein